MSYDIRKWLSKHLDASPAQNEVLINGEFPFFDPVIFSVIDESTIAQAALRTRGASGPSGLDADGWRRILVSKNFGRTSTELRKSIAEMACVLCTKEIEFVQHQPTSIEAYNYIACRLIPLDKNPGVRDRDWRGAKKNNWQKHPFNHQTRYFLKCWFITTVCSPPIRLRSGKSCHEGDFRGARHRRGAFSQCLKCL